MIQLSRSSANCELPTASFSAPLPLRRALLGERRRSLAGVLRGEDGAGDLPLALPELVLRPAVTLLHDLLGGGERERAVGGDRPRQLECGIQSAAVVGHPVHEPQLVAALGCD